MRHYFRETKLEAVRLFIEEGKKRANSAKQLGVPDPMRVKTWLRKYRKEGDKAFERKPRSGLIGRPSKKENREAYIACL